MPGRGCANASTVAHSPPPRRSSTTPPVTPSSPTGSARWRPRPPASYAPEALPTDLECTVITNSPTVATALLEHPSADLFLLGGRVFKHSAVACGAAAVEAAQNISADLCLIGVTGVHPEAGLTTGDAEDAAMKRALAARAAETYVLASSEKIGTASPYRVLPWGQITGVITDADPTDDVVQQLSALGVEILHSA